MRVSIVMHTLPPFPAERAQRAAVLGRELIAALRNVIDGALNAASKLSSYEEEWDAIMNVNLRGTFITNQEAFPYLRDNGGGRIVNFASGAGLYPYLQGAAYSASKAGVIAWTRTIAHEWGRSFDEWGYG